MAGIIVPVVIHLWNNKQGKVLSIGSLDFLDKTSLRRARSRRISDWWLLVLRCLLLILLALLLAGPVWKRQPDMDRAGWVLVGKGPVTDATQRMLDSLVHASFQRHDMEEYSWWENFHVLDRQAPAGIPFHVFTDGLLTHFSGVRPTTSRPVYWHVSAPKDSTVRWVQAAWKQGADSMGLIMGSSGATGTSYNYRVFGKDTTPVDTSTLHVVVHTDERYARDGQWVMGAVNALQQFTRRNIMISNHPEGADWVFWLSEKPLNNIKAPNILLYEPGQVTPVDTWIKGSDIHVDKVTGQTQRLQPIWTDGFGRPLLALEEMQGGRHYHFFSHFDPAWNGLVWSKDFPVRMGELLLNQPTKEIEGSDQAVKIQDRRVIDPAQVAPSSGDNGQQDAPAMTTSIDLSFFGWLLIFLTLVVERTLSFKKAKNG